MIDTWFDSKTAATYVGCKSVKAWYEWRKRHGIVKRANGTVNKADLDRALKYRGARKNGGSTRHPHSLANLQKTRTVEESTT